MNLKQIVIAGVLSLGIGVSVGASDLYDKVKDYLGEHGLPKIEHFMQHGIVQTRQGEVFYRQHYLLNNQVFIADFYPNRPHQIDANTIIGMLDNGADRYYFDNGWWIDPAMDGVSGNEEYLNPTDYKVE